MGSLGQGLEGWELLLLIANVAHTTFCCREHDASAPALNLMRDALAVSAAAAAAAAAAADVNEGDDALSLPGLVETVVVAQLLELQARGVCARLCSRT